MTRAPHKARTVMNALPSAADVQSPGRAAAASAHLGEATTEKPVPILMDQLPGLVWITNLEQRVTRACGNCLDTFTQGESFVPGLTMQEFFQTQDPDFPPIRAHRLAKGGYAAPFEFTRDRHFIGVTEPIFDAAGNPIGTISVAQDQTDYKITQQNQRVQFLRNLTSGMANHFNNWVTNVMGYTALALAKLPAKSEARKVLEQVEAASRNMAELVEQMLCYTQTTKLHPQPLHLSRLVEEVRLQLTMLVSKGTAIAPELAKDLPLILGDHGLIKNLVIHLVCSAAEMMSEGKGEIHIRTQRTRVNNGTVLPPFQKKQVPDGEYVWLQVSASGGKLEEKERLTLFEPFSSGKFTGRGLGLAAAKGIVSLHRGAIVAASAGGVAFHVLLPALMTADDSEAAALKALDKTKEIELPPRK